MNYASENKIACNHAYLLQICLKGCYCSEMLPCVNLVIKAKKGWISLSHREENDLKFRRGEYAERKRKEAVKLIFFEGKRTREREKKKKQPFFIAKEFEW